LPFLNKNQTILFTRRNFNDTLSGLAPARQSIFAMMMIAGAIIIIAVESLKPKSEGPHLILFLNKNCVGAIFIWRLAVHPCKVELP
jgi:hypothetical protein